jgi:hypothetical protein
MRGSVTEAWRWAYGDGANGGNVTATVDAYRQTAARSMSERELQDLVLAAARALGYVCYHTFDSRRSQAGFPDIVAVRAWVSGPPRVVFIELKSRTGRLKPDQYTWRGALTMAGAEYYLWRPDDWFDDTIIDTLSGPRPVTVDDVRGIAPDMTVNPWEDEG